MIVAPLLAVSLVVSVATGPLDEPGRTTGRPASVQSIVAATDCIVRTIMADPRWRQASADGAFGELIVDSMPACAPMVREMIDAYDTSYGVGTGEAFFMGPFLETLPLATSRRLKTVAPDR